MCDYLGAIISNKLKPHRDRLLFDQYCVDNLERLVNNCSAWDRWDATNNIPDELEILLNAAWLQKDGKQYLKLLRNLMYLHFEDDANDLAALQIECGENDN